MSTPPSVPALQAVLAVFVHTTKHAHRSVSRQVFCQCKVLLMGTCIRAHRHMQAPLNVLTALHQSLLTRSWSTCYSVF